MMIRRVGPVDIWIMMTLVYLAIFAVLSKPTNSVKYLIVISLQFMHKYFKEWSLEPVLHPRCVWKRWGLLVLTCLIDLISLEANTGSLIVMKLGAGLYQPS